MAANGNNLFYQNLVFRYDVSKTDDGVGGEEGTFCLCTLWCVVDVLPIFSLSQKVFRCVEALTRAGEYDKAMLQKANSMFEASSIYRPRGYHLSERAVAIKDFLLYLNHVGLCTEEISDSGEG